MQDLLAYRRAHIPRRSANSARETAGDLILQTTVLKVSHGMIVMVVSPLRSGADLQSERRAALPGRHRLLQFLRRSAHGMRRPCSRSCLRRRQPTLAEAPSCTRAPRYCRAHVGADDLLDCLGHGRRTVRADTFALDI